MSPESVLSYYRNNVKNGKGFEIKEPPLKFGECIVFMPSGAIRFFLPVMVRAGCAQSNSRAYIIIGGGDRLDFWSDFAEKDPSAQRISGAKYGCYVSFQKFIDDIRINMPNHFEWMLWNFV